MNRFDRNVFFQLVSAFSFFALILALVFWINRAVVLLDRILANGESIAVFLEISLLTLPTLIQRTLPIAAAVASIYIANRLSDDSELTIARATGFSPLQIAKPAFGFGAVVFVFMSLLSHVILPLADTQFNEAEESLRQNFISRLLTPGEFISPTDDVTIYIREVTSAGVLEDIFLADNRSEDTNVTYTATTAYLIKTDIGPQLIMRNGKAQRYSTEDAGLVVTEFDDFVFDLGSMLVADTGSTTIDPDILPSTQLFVASTSTQRATTKTRDQLRLVFHERWAGPLLGFVAALIGFTTLLTAKFSRFGATRNILVAVFLLIVIQILNTVFSGLSDDDPSWWIGLYIAPIVAMLILAWQLLMAMRPRQLRIPKTQRAT